MSGPDSQLLILRRWEEMAEYAYVALRHLPRSERFTLGAEVRIADPWRPLEHRRRSGFVRVEPEQPAVERENET